MNQQFASVGRHSRRPDVQLVHLNWNCVQSRQACRVSVPGRSRPVELPWFCGAPMRRRSLFLGKHPALPWMPCCRATQSTTKAPMAGLPKLFAIAPHPCARMASNDRKGHPTACLVASPSGRPQPSDLQPFPEIGDEPSFSPIS